MSGLAKGTLLGRVHDFLIIYLPKHRNVSPNTVRSYKKSLDQLLDYVKGAKSVPLADVTFEMITAETVAAFLDYVEDERKCSISTRNQRLTAIRSFIAYVAMVDIAVAANLTELEGIPLKKTVSTVIEYMSEEAVSAVLNVVDTTTPLGFRDRCIMMLMYDSAARIQELIDVKLADFRWGKKPTVALHGKGAKIRTVPISDKTAEHIRLYITQFHADTKNDPNAPLFYSVIHGNRNHLSLRCVRELIRKHGESARAKCAEVPENVYPHMFGRHSRAMHLYQHGMPLEILSQWLGHANLETTLMFYARADTEHKRRAIDKATASGKKSPTDISPKRFTITDEATLKRLAGLD
jgi:site-specific recombinase XerD